MFQITDCCNLRMHVVSPYEEISYLFVNCIYFCVESSDYVHRVTFHRECFKTSDRLQIYLIFFCGYNDLSLIVRVIRHARPIKNISADIQKVIIHVHILLPHLCLII